MPNFHIYTASMCALLGRYAFALIATAPAEALRKALLASPLRVAR